MCHRLRLFNPLALGLFAEQGRHVGEYALYMLFVDRRGQPLLYFIAINLCLLSCREMKNSVVAAGWLFLLSQRHPGSFSYFAIAIACLAGWRWRADCGEHPDPADADLQGAALEATVALESAGSPAQLASRVNTSIAPVIHSAEKE